MLTKILCTECGDVLRKGDPGAKTEYKICISCVTKNTPASKKIIKDSKPTVSIAAQVQNEVKNFTERLKTIHVEIVYKYIEDELCLVLELSDYLKQKFSEFGFPRHKLQEFMDTIDEIKEKEKEEEDK